MPISQLEISNLALSEVPAGTIASIAENSLSAIEARRHYPVVLSEMLEEFGYDLAVTRSALAATTNSRASEWGFAYAMPSNCAFPLRVIPDFESPAGSVVLLAGQTLAPVGNLFGPDPFRIPYVIAEGILYANEPNASLEYVREDPSITLFPPLMIRALVLELASRLVMPLLKSETREKVLIGKAEVAKQRAIAANLGRKPSSAWLPASEDERARDGWF